MIAESPDSRNENSRCPQFCAAKTHTFRALRVTPVDAEAE